MANTIREKELKRDWPFTTGLTAETTKTSGRAMGLVATEGSFVPRRLKVGL